MLPIWLKYVYSDKFVSLKKGCLYMAWICSSVFTIQLSDVTCRCVVSIVKVLLWALQCHVSCISNGNNSNLFIGTPLNQMVCFCFSSLWRIFWSYEDITITCMWKAAIFRPLLATCPTPLSWGWRGFTVPHLFWHGASISDLIGRTVLVVAFYD